MKIVLISPYPDIKSFGLRILSACLKQQGHDVQLIFLPKHFTERYEKKTLNEVVELSKRADLIGISLMTNFFDNAVQITQALRENCCIPILWGGIHPTVRPEECLDYADMVCIGEGEEALMDLANKIKDGKCFYDVQSIWFKDKEKIIKNPLRPLKELDSIPFQDYSYDNHYILNNELLKKMNPQLLNEFMRGTYVTMPTRGCPFGCAYCCNNTFNKMHANQNPVRKRSIDNLIKECVDIKSRLPFINNIVFDDDAFFIYSLQEINEFCKKYRENIGLPLKITGATPTTLTREKLSFLVGAGLTEIKMGIQSGSERTKKLYSRHHSNMQVERTARIINEFKDKIKVPAYDIILDNPWETDKDLIETLMFLAKLPIPYQLTCFSLAFYPGTELYEKAKNDGIVTDDLQDIYRKDYNFYSARKTYLNKLFFLLSDYAFYGVGISQNIMRLLTNQKIRQIKLHWLLYIFLKMRIFPLKIKRIKFMLYDLFKDIKRGNWTIIRGKIFRWF